MPQLTLQEKMFALAADHALFEQAKANAFNYLDSAFERSPYPTDAALAGLAAFDEPLFDVWRNPQQFCNFPLAVGRYNTFKFAPDKRFWEAPGYSVKRLHFGCGCARTYTQNMEVPLLRFPKEPCF